MTLRTPIRTALSVLTLAVVSTGAAAQVVHTPNDRIPNTYEGAIYNYPRTG